MRKHESEMANQFKKVTVWASACGMFALILGLGAARLAGAAAPAAEDPGKKTFEDNCSVCHDEDGSGNTPIGMSLNIPDLRSDDVQKLPDADLINVVTNGKDPMPAFKDKLSADDIKNVVAYVRVLGKNKK